MATEQPNLFASGAYGDVIVPPSMLAAKSDPETSHEAAKKIVESGKAERHREIVWALVMASPGKTYRELWEAANERERQALGDAVELMRRLNDLHKIGSVRQGESRICLVRGSKMVTWHPAGKDR